MRPYNAKEVSVEVDSVTLTDFQDGTFVEASKNEDSFDTLVDALGAVQVSENNNPLGTVSFTLSQNSPYLTFMRTKAQTMKPFTVWVTRSGGSVKERAGGTQALVKKKPGVSFADKASERKFELVVFDYKEE